MVNDLARVGVTVIAEKCDVVKLEDVKRLVAERSKDMPPIRGVVHGAMVVKVCISNIHKIYSHSISVLPNLSSPPIPLFLYNFPRSQPFVLVLNIAKIRIECIV